MTDVAICFVLLWPATGILILWAWTPLWLKRRDPVGFGIMHFMAAFLGPIALLWPILQPRTKQDIEWDAKERQKRP